MNTFYDNLEMVMLLAHANIDDAEQDSAYIDMSQRHRVAFVGTQEATPAAETIDVFKVVQATASAGTGKKDVTGLAITDFTNASVIGDKLILELDAIALDHANDYKFAAVTVGGSGDNTDQFYNVFAVADSRYASENLNLNATDVLTNFKKVP